MTAAATAAGAAAVQRQGEGGAACDKQQQQHGVVVVPQRKPLTDRRSFAATTLPNGVRIVVAQDAEAEFAAACANVQCGYFDDGDLAGSAHFLEHLVHLGSAPYPDEREYKRFLAAHGGSSNASTGMAHTRYHLKVHAGGLQGALARLGAALAAPLLRAESAAREVENVDAEYSRNANSDARKLLQLRRALALPPYSNFSTGSLATLRDAPAAAGVDVPARLRALWGAHYRAGATCVAVVGPQPAGELLAMAAAAFAGMRPSADASAGTDGGGGGGPAAAMMMHQQQQQQHQEEESSGDKEQQPLAAAAAAAAPLGRSRYPDDVAGPGGRLVRVRPERDLRDLEVAWFVPCGMQNHSATKPWAWASHLLGHEGPGSAAHLLKRQGLVQGLEAGVGDEVRLGRGWLYFRVSMSLTQRGEAHVPHVLATVFRAVNALAGASDAELDATWREAAELAQLRFDYADQGEPLPTAQTAASALHYHPPDAVLSGPCLMTRPDPAALRGFVRHLAVGRCDVFWHSRRHAAGDVDQVEPHYKARYAVAPLPAAWLREIEAQLELDGDGGGGGGGGNNGHAAAAAAGVSGGGSNSNGSTTTMAEEQQQQLLLTLAPGQLHLPPPCWALPRDLALRGPEPGEEQGAAAAVAGIAGAGAQAAPELPPPAAIVERPGLCVWHRHDVRLGLPKVHLRARLATPLAGGASPRGAVAARLLARLAADALLPEVAYPAELAGTAYELSVDHGGFLLRVVGFPGVAQRLLREALDALALNPGGRLTERHVVEHFARIRGRLVQSLANWAQNNPAAHAEYAAAHALRTSQQHQHQHHHHNRELLAAAEAATPGDVLELARRLASGAPGALHVDLLVYGNASRAEAEAVAAQVADALAPAGLLPGCAWPPGGDLLALAPAPMPGGSSSTSNGSGNGSGSGSGSSAVVTFLPSNPNPPNGNHGVCLVLPLGPDDVEQAVLLDLFVQAASKSAFHHLRTQQRLGYSVSLGGGAFRHRQLALTLRVQAPSATPAAVTAAALAWLKGFREELAGGLGGGGEGGGDALATHRAALVAKYTEPARSQREAARRAWAPIASRSLRWRRRADKAAAAEALTLEALLAWYDARLSPSSSGATFFVAQVWGGQADPPAEASAAAAAAAAPGGGVVLRESDGDELAAWKAAQRTQPPAAVVLPPLASAGAGAVVEEEVAARL